MLYEMRRDNIGTAIYLLLLIAAFGLSVNPAIAQGQGGEILFPLIENNVIIENDADNGSAIASFNSSPMIRNNIIVDNGSTDLTVGGAIYSYGTVSSPKITGNTISLNTAAPGQVGGIYVEEGEAAISNCILWQNGGDLWNSNATYSNVTSLSANPGPGNISVDPAFVQTSNPDTTGYYRLSETSPCIDIGDPAYRPAAKETDIKGCTRYLIMSHKWG